METYYTKYTWHAHEAYKTSGSESRPKKTELMSEHSKKHNYCESLHITMKPVFVLMKTSLMAVIIIIIIRDYCTDLIMHNEWYSLVNGVSYIIIESIKLILSIK